MTFFCGSAVVSTLASGVTSEPLAEAAGMIVVPFEKSINGIGSWIGEINQTFQDKQDLIDKNQELQDAVDTLTEQNNILIQNQSELSRLQELTIWMRNIPHILRLLPESFPRTLETGTIPL